MWRIVVVLAVIAACGKKDKPAASSDTGSAEPVAPAVDVPTPGPGSLVGKEPPTAESAHVELAFALARWAASERADIHGASIKTWLDPGTQLTLDESKVIVGHDRELMWRR